MITLQETLRAPFYAPFYATLARNTFAGEGVDIRLVSSPSPGQALDALMDGTADVGWGGPMRVNLGNRTIPGADLVCFAEIVTRDPFFLVTRGAMPAFTPAALAGLRVGSVTEVPTPWLCLQHDMRLAGLDPAAIARVAGRGMAENAALLLAGGIDVAQLFQPFAEALVEQGCHIWWPAAERGPCSYTTLYARRATLAVRRPELLAMVRALYRTQTWLQGLDGATLAGTVASYFPAIPRQHLAGALDRYLALGIWGRDPVLPRGGYTRLCDSLVSGGMVDESVPFEDAVDNSLAGQVLAEA